MFPLAGFLGRLVVRSSRGRRRLALVVPGRKSVFDHVRGSPFVLALLGLVPSFIRGIILASLAPRRLAGSVPLVALGMVDVEVAEDQVEQVAPILVGDSWDVLRNLDGPVVAKLLVL